MVQRTVISHNRGDGTKRWRNSRVSNGKLGELSGITGEAIGNEMIFVGCLQQDFVENRQTRMSAPPIGSQKRVCRHGVNHADNHLDLDRALACAKKLLLFLIGQYFIVLKHIHDSSLVPARRKG